MSPIETPPIFIRLGKFDDYKGPICLNVDSVNDCEFCISPCNQISSKVIMDALSMDKSNLYFEEQESFYQATNFLLPNTQIRGNFERYSLIFKLAKDMGRIRTDLIMRIRADFLEKAPQILEVGDFRFAQEFCTHWEQQLKSLKFVTELEEERLRTEAALNSANEILTASNLILKVNVYGELTFLNPFAEKFFDFASDELLGTTVAGKIFPLTYPEGFSYEEWLNHYLDNPESDKFQEVEIKLKEGSKKWVAWTHKPIYNSVGKIEEILSVGIDITPLKKTEQKLAAEKALVQLYFDIAGVMLIVLDPDLHISNINKKGSQLLGYAKEKIIGWDWCEKFVPKKERSSIYKELKEVCEGKHEFTKNYIVTKSGQKRRIFWHNVPFFNENGDFTGIICSGEDITEQQEAEKKLIKAKAVKTLKDQMF